MIKLTEKTDNTETIDATLTLPLESRSKSRLRVTLENGQDAGIFLERGATLKDGELLCSADGFTVRVKAAHETLSTILCKDSHLLARACYHLGNRHIPLQIEPESISYLHDHVLDEMLRGMGLNLVVKKAPFEPEPGAYGGDSIHAEHHHH